MKTTPNPKARAGLLHRREGVALLTALILGILFSIMGLTLYTMSTLEWKQAKYRDDSGSAFWLADAAIEHAKGQLFNDMTWSAGFDSIPRGEGYYNLAIRDSFYQGDSATWIYAQGFVPRAGGGYTERDVEVFANIQPAAFAYAIFAQGDIDTKGNVEVCGRVHSNGDADMGGSFGATSGCPLDPPTVSDGFQVTPPAIRTEHQYYPSTTYYYVVGRPSAGAQDAAWIMSPDSVTWEPLGNPKYTLRTGYSVYKVDTLLINYTNPIDYSFSNDAEIAAMFDWTTGQCKRNTVKGDQFVVVNFGEYILGAVPRTATLDITAATPIKSAIFNTRYKPSAYPDTSLSGLLKTVNWEGGNNTFKQIVMTPENGIAFIIHNYDNPGNSNMSIGTAAKPCVCYVTGSVGKWTANGAFYGTLVVLGNITDMAGTPDFFYKSEYQIGLPPYLQPDFWGGASGFAEILNWREPAPKYGS